MRSEHNRRGSVVRYQAILLIRAVLDALFLLPLLLLAVVSRFLPRPVEVGLGPTPIINSVYHKAALEKFGHSTEFFVDALWYYTFGYDYAPRLLLTGPARAFVPYWLMARTLLRYRTLYTYFDGGPLRSTAFLCFLEPQLLKLAGIRTVVMAFGADVGELTRIGDPYFVHAMSQDYPYHRLLRRRIARKIDVWTSWADHLVSGVDWVRTMYHWDSLTLGHFAIDTEAVRPAGAKPARPDRPLLVLHAPNHRTLKGTTFLEAAVCRLRKKGVAIELRLVEKRPNAEVLAAIAEADLVVDQLVIGWYAMLALETMALATACVCYIDPKLEQLYTRVGLLAPSEMPLISATPETIEEVLQRAVSDRDWLIERGRRGRAYVEAHHSLVAIGAMFHAIQAGLFPVPPSHR